MPRKIAPTYQHRLFNDDELKLASHDKIVRWADIAIRENIGLFLDRIGYKISRNERGEACLWAEKKAISIEWEYFDYQQSNSTTVAMTLIKDLVRKKIPNPPAPAPVKVDRVSWEEILKNDRGTVVGAIDLLAVISLPTLSLEFRIDRARITLETLKKIPRPLHANEDTFIIQASELGLVDSDFVTRFPDGFLESEEKVVVSGLLLFAVSDVRWEFGGHDHEYKQVRLAIEAKSAIPAVGELIRQMKFYRGHVGGAKLFVVAPADAWPADAQTILREQGIEPINYQSNFP
jgi:hypothetical protein